MVSKKTIQNFFYFAAILLVSSCGNQKKNVYFNNENLTNQTTDSIPNFYFSPIFQSNDLLSISISSSDLTTVIPFNLEGKNKNDNSNNFSKKSGYIIDKDGY
ncbi:MAG: hypothetical protein ACK5B9_13375, partial [Flavobacteriia bacterium]